MAAWPRGTLCTSAGEVFSVQSSELLTLGGTEVAEAVVRAGGGRSVSTHKTGR